MNIPINNLRKKELIEEVQSYFRREHDESLGDLKAEMLLEFFIAKLGPRIYNQAIDDASAFLQEKLIDLEGTLSLPE